MIIQCKKCSENITNKSLFPNKRGKGYKNIIDDRGRENKRIRNGSFLIEKASSEYYGFDYYEERGISNTTHSPEMIIVGRESVNEDIIPQYITGGCCDHPYGSQLVCKCGSLIGVMAFDCHEYNTLNIFSSSVKRVY